MTGMIVFGFVLAAVLVGMACVTKARVRAVRQALNPSAPELPDAAFTVGRVVLLGMAGLGVFTTVQLMGASDSVEWSDDELTGAAGQAVTALDGSSRFGDIFGDDSGFDDEYATMIEDEVVEHGGGDAPQHGVDAAPAAANEASDALYTVAASGAKATVCVHVERTRSKGDDYEPPGVAGGSGTVTVPSYEFTVTSRAGDC
ncbi:hypothetical protein GCM10009837_38690 [Streptomyces durmitorensis]|uniref:Secreted protein n=1 Tax=Streptomyces durmitorensis TaxID=319947 RepID=A0ABY4Q5Y9_9ACTN|nr:hypothetical protein [Streptomyces durmitorensis]UQT61064.1 hypothetical protein M4V62_41665 [Streptomyces durmitorensis]